MFRRLSKPFLKNIFNGAIIGIANIIPGVSGGTLAVVLGIYDQLIESIGNFLTNKEKRKEYALFLIPIGIGTIAAIGAFSKVIDFLLTNHPQPTFFFFIGLVLGSIPFIYKAHSEMSPSITKIIVFIIALSAMAVLATLNSSDLKDSVHITQNLGFLLLSGIIAAGTMVIPGISGSLILLIMGSYHTIIRAISDANLTIIAVVGVGAILGILIFTKIINLFLTKWPALTYYAILGLIIGSLFKLWPGLTYDVTGGISLVMLVLGGWTAKKLA